MGFYCVDNLPVELIPIFAELHSAGEGDFSRAALLVDAREGTSGFFLSGGSSGRVMP